jgi:signal peptidase I
MNRFQTISAVVPDGALFVMGDNRNQSFDSREIRPVRMEDVVGKADVIILPIKEMHIL